MKILIKPTADKNGVFMYGDIVYQQSKDTSPWIVMGANGTPIYNGVDKIVRPNPEEFLPAIIETRAIKYFKHSRSSGICRDLGTMFDRMPLNHQKTLISMVKQMGLKP